MADNFDFVIVGGGSAGAVVAARLSEDANASVCLIEAGGEPPPAEAIPAAVAALQNDPNTDWMYTGDPGGIGKGVVGGQMMVPRGKMLGGSSGINYMAYVRGHPGDFDSWAAAGAQGWAYDEVLPYFKKSEDLAPSDDIVVDTESHGVGGPLGVAVRRPGLHSSRQFVEAAEAVGMKRGDYNGRDRCGPDGVASLFQTTTRDGRRSSTFHAFLEPIRERVNLTIVTHAHVERVLLDGSGDAVRAAGVVYRTDAGATTEVTAHREVVVCAGAIGSPHILLHSGVGPSDELAGIGISAVVDLPDVGRHLRDHLHVPMFFPADGVAETMTEVALSLGPDALRQPDGPLPADPADDVDLPDELVAVKAEAERRQEQWGATGDGLASSSMYDAVAFFSTGLDDTHTHDAQIGFLACGYTPDIWHNVFRLQTDEYFSDTQAQLHPDAGVVVFSPNPVQLHSEGSVTLASADPHKPPRIDLNYFADPHDVIVTVTIMRRALEMAKAWPGNGLGSLMVPPRLAEQHGYKPGDEPSDAMLEDWARHYALTIYHETSTCRMGEVVDSALRVHGITGLRVADASVMPNVVSGNTNAASIMIGEKAAEMIAADHDIHLAEYVGPTPG